MYGDPESIIAAMRASKLFKALVETTRFAIIFEPPKLCSVFVLSARALGTERRARLC